MDENTEDDPELDLAILDAGNPNQAVVLARCKHDLAIEALPYTPPNQQPVALATVLDGLATFRKRIVNAISSACQPWPAADLAAFGTDLFNLTVQGRVYDLYRQLPFGKHVRIQLLTNNAALQEVPWEDRQDPAVAPGPRRYRSIVRLVHPSIGLTPKLPPSLKDPNRKIKILFVSADPVNQTPVSWANVQRSILRTFNTGLPNRFDLIPLTGANRISLRQELQNDYDIFHFVGHGEVIDGEGHLVLQRQGGDNSSRLSSHDLSLLLRDKGLRLVVLSACESSAGSFAVPYNVIADGLVKEGIPAVVANQFVLPDRTVANFVRGMYEELLRSGDIDLAVGAAREALGIDLREGRNQTDAIPEWGICTLYRHLKGAKIFDVS